MITEGAQDELISLVLFSLHVNDMRSPLHYAELSIYADDTAFIATSSKLVMFIS